jgi:hypothetical protein
MASPVRPRRTVCSSPDGDRRGRGLRRNTNPSRKGSTVLEQASSFEELAIGLTQDIRAKDLPEDFSEQIALALVKEFAVLEAPRPADGTFGALRGRYAIRKDDVKIFDAVTDGLKAAAGVSFFTAQKPLLAANVAIGVALAKLLRALAMRGTVLDRDKLEVLTILKCKVALPSDAGLKSEEILDFLRTKRQNVDLGWLQQQLDFLASVPTWDGASTKLASADQSGRWRSHV